MALSNFRALLDGQPVYLLNRSATYAIGTAEILPLAGIVSMDKGAEFDLLARRLGTRILSWDPVPGERLAQPDEDIEEVLPWAGQQLLSWLSEHTRPAALWCPRLCRSAWDFAERHRLRNLCPAPDLTAWLRDKRNVLPALAAQGLPVLKGCWISPYSESFARLAARFGLPFVLQTPTSDSGLGTTIVQAEEDLATVWNRPQVAAVWAAPFATALSMNVNACVTARHVFVACPSVQLTGLAFCLTSGPRYCGNDYAAARFVEASARLDLVEQTHRIGEWLRSLGYRGIFGLDYVMGREGRFHPVDLNPRWQGSTALLAQAQALRGHLPLPVLSVAEQLDLLSESELLRHGERLGDPVEASQFFLHAPGFRSRCLGAVRPGVYSSQDTQGEGEGFQWEREGCHLRDLAGGGGILLGGGIPHPGTVLAPRIPILRVFRLAPVCRTDFAGYEPWAEEAAAFVYANLHLAPASAASSSRESSRSKSGKKV